MFSRPRPDVLAPAPPFRASKRNETAVSPPPSVVKAGFHSATPLRGAAAAARTTPIR